MLFRRTSQPRQRAVSSTVLAASMLCGVLLACGEEPPQLTIDARSAAITACSSGPNDIPESVTWAEPDGDEICQGRYRYDSPVMCAYTNDPVCQTCQRWNRCEERTPDTDITTYRATHQFCVPDGELGQVCSPHWNAANAWCDDLKNARRSHIENQSDKDATSASRQLIVLYAETFQCRVTVDFDHISHSRRPECGCEDYINCLELCDLQANYSPTGMSRNDVIAELDALAPEDFNPYAHPKYPEKTVDAVLECTTGEDLPSTSFAAKFDRVHDALDDPTIASPDLRDLYVRQLKMIAEYGDIGSANEPRLEDLYRDDPDINPSCGSNFTGTEPGCDPELTWRYHLCTRLTSDHLKADLVELRQELCTSEFIAAFEAHLDDVACPADDYLDSMLELQSAILDRLSAVLAAEEYANRASWTDTAAKILSIVHHDWYQPLRDMDQSGLAQPILDRVRLDDELTRNLASFWNRATDAAQLDGARDQAIDDEDAAGLVSALDARFGAGVELDQRVLEAGLSSVTIHGEPTRALAGESLAAILGQAIAATIDRMNGLNLFHDYACAIADCASAPSTSKLATLWQAMAALDDHATLTQLSATMSNPGYAGWGATFAEVAQDDYVRAELTALASELGESYDDALAGPMESWPAPARRLIASLRTARERAANLEGSGLFSGDDGKFLQTAVHVSKRIQIRNYIESKANHLAQRNAAYESDILAIVDRVIQTLGASTNLTAARDRELALADEYDDLFERRAMHMVAAGDPGNREADLVAALEAADGVIDSTTYFNVGGVTEVPLNLDGSNASWTANASTITDFAASAAIALDQDQLLSLDVSGTWAPKCSLEARHVLNPDGSSFGPITFPSEGGVPNPETGPEGYALQASSGAYQAYDHSKTRTHTFRGSVTAEVCAENPFGSLGGWIFSAKACVSSGYEYSRSESRRNSNGHDTRVSATFSGGMRLSNTPFPAAPAGSLLAVEMPRGAIDLSEIRDVHLVRRGNTAVRAAADSDLYLVVNDMSCQDQDTLYRLTLHGARLSSADDIARNLLARIGQVLGQVASHREQLVATRDILPSELAAIRSQALLDVISGSGPQVPLSSYPEGLTAIFNAFLDKELLRLERIVRIANIDRQLEIMEAELVTVRSEIDNAERSQALVSLLPSWHMRTLREDYLRDRSHDLSRAVREYFFPVFQLWHPGSLDALRTAHDAAIDHLIEVDLGTSLDQVVGDVIALTDVLLDAYDDAATAGDGSDPPLRNVILSLNAAPPDCGPPFCVPGGGSSSYVRLDQTITDPIWAALEFGGGATFPVMPDNLYTDGSSSGQIACNRQLPVLHHMALVVKSPQPYTGTDRALNGQYNGREQLFSTAVGPESYTLFDDTWLPFDMPVLYASDEADIESVFNGLINSPTAPGVIGLSPFSNFELRELDGAKWSEWGLDQAEEIFLVMRVESVRSSVLSPEWIASCADGT